MNMMQRVPAKTHRYVIRTNNNSNNNSCSNSNNENDVLKSLEQYYSELWDIIVCSESALRRVCKSFDKNGDGFIDKAEMTAVFEELNRDLSSSVCIYSQSYKLCPDMDKRLHLCL